MTTRLFLLSTVVVGLGAVAPAQQAQIQNGHVEVRQTTSIDREVARLTPGATDAVWVAWRVPMVDGERSMCCWYTDTNNYPNGVRGCMVESSSAPGNNVPQITRPTGPVPLEAGTGLVVLLRLVNNHVERLRTLGDDCPLDAGGRTVYWLEGVSPADSLKYLDSLTQLDTLMPDGQRRIADSAISAIALHRDAGADAILTRLASAGGNTGLRGQAASWLGSARGASGFAELRRLIGSETVPEVRRQFVRALGETRQAGTVEALRGLTRDTDARVRADAAYSMAVRGGQPVVSELTTIIQNDPDDTVKRRAVDGVAQLPQDGGVPLLIQLARTSPSLVVRKEAVTRLGQSKDARAVAFLEELLKK